MDISVIILTFNESIHIQRCIENVRPWVQDVFVVDSFSSDRTVAIAKELGAQVFQNKWEGQYARQFNWALDHLPIRTKWLLRLDADEYLYPGLIAEIHERLSLLPNDVSGVVFKRRHIFLGRWMRRGTYPVKLLRMFQCGKARCEQRLMDEHMELSEGRSVEFTGDFADHNLNDLSWWSHKHVGYAIREAADLLDVEYNLFADEDGTGARDFKNEVMQRPTQAANGGEIGTQAAAKRRLKMKYARAPLFWRAFVYFCMRYFLRGGFLEGRAGFLWHSFQGLWYRMLVDAKIYEIKQACGNDRQAIRTHLRMHYGLAGESRIDGGNGVSE